VPGRPRCRKGTETRSTPRPGSFRPTLEVLEGHAMHSSVTNLANQTNPAASTMQFRKACNRPQHDQHGPQYQRADRPSRQQQLRLPEALHPDRDELRALLRQGRETLAGLGVVSGPSTARPRPRPARRRPFSDPPRNLLPVHPHPPAQWSRSSLRSPDAENAPKQRSRRSSRCFPSLRQVPTFADNPGCPCPVSSLDLGFWHGPCVTPCTVRTQDEKDPPQKVSWPNGRPEGKEGARTLAGVRSVVAHPGRTARPPSDLL
jgi:hypothetical protein